MTHEPDLPSTLAEMQRGWRRRWLVWAVIYVVGFALLSAADQAQGWPFYGWAIGWALAKGLWDEAHFLRAVKNWRGRQADKKRDRPE
jgi:hypothetical protein